MEAFPMPSGDTFSSLVTRGDTSETRCVTHQVLSEQEVTEAVTHMTRFDPRVPYACVCARTRACRTLGRSVTMRHLSPDAPAHGSSMAIPAPTCPREQPRYWTEFVSRVRSGRDRARSPHVGPRRVPCGSGDDGATSGAGRHTGQPHPPVFKPTHPHHVTEDNR